MIGGFFFGDTLIHFIPVNSFYIRGTQPPYYENRMDLHSRMC